MRWFVTWATAAPLEVTLWGLLVILAVLTGLFVVGLIRAVRDEMREHEDDDGRWPQENSARSRRGWR